MKIQKTNEVKGESTYWTSSLVVRKNYNLARVMQPSKVYTRVDDYGINLYKYVSGTTADAVDKNFIRRVYNYDIITGEFHIFTDEEECKTHWNALLMEHRDLIESKLNKINNQLNNLLVD